MSFIVIAYHTDDVRYTTYATALLETIKKFNLDHDVVTIPSFGNWLKGTNYKSAFIDSMQQKYPDKDLLYVDADSGFLRAPVLFDEPYPHDVGLFLRSQKELHAATIYLKASANARVLVQRWKLLQEENPRATDQCLLQKLVNIYGKAGLVDIGQLPHAYCCKFDDTCAEPVVITQYQASRKASSRV